MDRDTAPWHGRHEEADMLETRESGCHCGRVRFRAGVDLERLSHCSCSICTKKGILLLSTDLANFELLRGRSALKAYTFGTGVAQHTFCSHCGMHAFYIPRLQPHRVTVNARCLDDIDPASLKPMRFFDGRHWEDAQSRRIAETGQAPPPGARRTARRHCRRSSTAHRSGSRIPIAGLVRDS
jgi:hypothetical protein